jgi:hypothetical protein
LSILSAPLAVFVIFIFLIIFDNFWEGVFFAFLIDILYNKNNFYGLSFPLIYFCFVLLSYLAINFLKKNIRDK